MKRKWGINGRFLAQPQTGVQRYASEIVMALDAILADAPSISEGLDVELLLPPDHKHALELRAISTRVLPDASGHHWEQVVLPRSARGGLLSLCNTGPVFHQKHLLCIHDANTRLAPESYSAPFRLLYRVLQPQLGRRVRAVTTVSSYSASQLSRLKIAESRKITVIPNGHEHVLRWRPEHTAETRRVSGPDTIVVVGSLAPHKNVGLILGLADRLAEIGIRIAVVGMRDSRIFAEAGKNFDAPNVFWLGRIDDNALAALLRDSLCLCFPSLTEGFGLPALEAMALGCPVVTTDCASLPEVCGTAALYASPLDPDAWLRQITALKNSPTLASELASSGPVQASHFSWTNSALSYLRLMA